MSPPFSGSKNKPSKKPARKQVTSDLIFSGVYGIITQKIEIFITTAVRTSNPTYVSKKENDKAVPVIGHGDPKGY
jgi:hypothetical protein